MAAAGGGGRKGGVRKQGSTEVMRGQGDEEVGEEVELETVGILTSAQRERGDGGKEGERCDRGRRSSPNDG